MGIHEVKSYLRNPQTTCEISQTLLSVRISMAFFRSKSLIFRWNSCNVSRTAARLVELICWQRKVFFCKTSHFSKMATVVSTSGRFSITSSIPVSWPALATYMYMYIYIYIYTCIYIYKYVCIYDILWYSYINQRFSAKKNNSCAQIMKIKIFPMAPLSCRPTEASHHKGFLKCLTDKDVNRRETAKSSVIICDFTISRTNRRNLPNLAKVVQNVKFWASRATEEILRRSSDACSWGRLSVPAMSQLSAPQQNQSASCSYK